MLSSMPIVIYNVVFLKPHNLCSVAMKRSWKWAHVRRLISRAPPLFGSSVYMYVLVSAFVMHGTVGPVSCLLFWQCRRAQPYVKVGARPPPYQWSRRKCLFSQSYILPLVISLKCNSFGAIVLEQNVSACANLLTCRLVRASQIDCCVVRIGRHNCSVKCPALWRSLCARWTVKCTTDNFHGLSRGQYAPYAIQRPISCWRRRLAWVSRVLFRVYSMCKFCFRQYMLLNI